MKAVSLLGLVSVCILAMGFHFLGDESSQGKKSSFDAALAKKLGADAYGMKKYVMVFLKAGPNRSQNQEEAMKIQRAHLENIGRLADEGKIVLAGPFLDGGELRGIFIFDVPSVEEAKKLTDTDPAVKAGRLIMELHPWYGSAGLVDVNRIHKLIAEKQV